MGCPRLPRTHEIKNTKLTHWSCGFKRTLLPDFRPDTIFVAIIWTCSSHDQHALYTQLLHLVASLSEVWHIRWILQPCHPFWRCPSSKFQIQNLGVPGQHGALRTVFWKKNPPWQMPKPVLADYGPGSLPIQCGINPCSFTHRVSSWLVSSNLKHRNVCMCVKWHCHQKWIAQIP